MKRAGMLMGATLVVLALTGPSQAYDPHRGAVGEAALQFRIGGFHPSGGGELWDTNEEVFTLDHSDFNDLVFGLTYVHSINNHLEVGFNADFYEAREISAYRGFVDEDGFPILHDTELRTVPLTLDLRFLPGGRYRIRGARGHRVMQPAFYIGAGLGVDYWEYEEVGDFLDFTFDPPEIFLDRFKDTGTAFEAHVLAGLELPLGDRTNLLLEGRYSSADDEPSGDFAGLGRLELGGASAYAGLSFRF